MGPVLRASLSEVSVLYCLGMGPGRRQIEPRSVRRCVFALQTFFFASRFLDHQNGICAEDPAKKRVKKVIAGGLE